MYVYGRALEVALGPLPPSNSSLINRNAFIPMEASLERYNSGFQSIPMLIQPIN